MTDTTNLPPLPEPVGDAYVVYARDQWGQDFTSHGSVYDEDQMHAYASASLAAAVVPAEAGWVMLGPDGTRFVGETPFKAASQANRHRVQVDPVAAKQFHDAIEELRKEGEAENERLTQMFGSLNCPACGGSGHVGDTAAALSTQEAPVAGWQPIETADKNKPWLLWWRNCRDPAVGRYIADERGEGWMCDGDRVLPRNQADCLYYHPLPAAPNPSPEGQS